MIIGTNNPQVAILLADICLRMPDGSGWSTATATASQLDSLTTALWRDHRGEWTMTSDNPGPTIPEEELNQLDTKTWQAFILAPAFINAGSNDLIVFLEEVYRHPVTPGNYQRVAQLFRLWYATVAPNEYHEPSWGNVSMAGPWFNWRYPAPPSKGRNAKKRMREDEAVRQYGWKSASELITAIAKGDVTPPTKPEE